MRIYERFTLLIDGNWLEGKGKSFTSTDPATKKTIWSKQGASEAQVQEAVLAAKNAVSVSGNGYGFEERAQNLSKICHTSRGRSNCV